MPDAQPPDWVRLCLGEGLDPAEVRLVLDRYRAYERYYRSGSRGEPLPLAAWFNWYRMETASEATQQGPSPSGCSVEDDARNRGVILRPQAFLKVLSVAAGAA